MRCLLRRWRFMRPVLGLSFVAALFMPLAAESADVARPPPAGGISLSEAISLVVQNNPTLVGQQFTIAQAVARRDHADLRPGFSVGGELENFLPLRSLGVGSGLEATLRLSTVIELGDKRALRIGAADQDVNAATLQRDIYMLDLLTTVTRRFIGNLVAQEKVEIARDHVALARQISDAVKTRINAGLGSPLEEGNAAIRLNHEEIALGEADADFRRTWAVLAATWGAPPDGVGRAAGDIHAMAPLPPFAEYAAKLETNPRITIFAAERAAAEARAKLARAGRAPDVNINAGVRHLEGPGTQALVLGFSVPLGTKGRNAAAEREADAAASWSAYAETAGKIDNMATLYALYEEARQARASYSALHGNSYPAALSTLKRAQDGFRAGRFSLLEISTAQEQLHTVESAMVDAANIYHLSIAELERLTNEPVPIQQSGAQGDTP